MPWSDQQPEPTDIVISSIHITVKGEGLPVYVEIDKLPDGSFRATGGNLFGSMEIARNNDLETLLRQVAKTKLTYSTYRPS